ncbi:MAG: bacteriohemerythrin [Georgfuchsia sp.]
MAAPSLIQWSPKLSVGIAIIDQQHQELVRIINELYEAMTTGQGRNVLGDIFNRLVKYTADHFSTEERLMSQHSYPQAVDHKAKHADLVKTALDLQEKFKSGKLSISLDTMTFLKEWLSKHILVTDKVFGAFLSTKGVK